MLRHAAFAVLLAGVTTPALADGPASPELNGPESNSSELNRRDDIVITADRTPTPRDESGQAITVIDAETIRTRQTAVISDLLRTTPGVSITRNGTIGGTTSINIRGAENDQTLVLIDGVRINDPSSPGNGANLAPVLTGNISRIEVLRGPNSVIWGSQAIGGIVSIETDAPTQQLALDARAEGGYAGTANVAANVSGGAGPIEASGGAYYYRTDGISSFDQSRGGTERDGFNSYALNGKVKARLAPGLSLDTRVYYIDARVGIDGGFPLQDTPERSNTRQLTLYSGVSQELAGGRFKQHFAFTYTNVDHDNRDATQTPTTTFDSNGVVRHYEYQGVFDVAKPATLIFGAEHENSSLRTASPSSFDPNPVPTHASVGITSGYAQAVLKPIEGVTLTGGVRHDAHDTFGGQTTFGGNAVVTPNHGATLIRATYAEGFKAPTLYQLLSEYGNAALQPERARSVDVGVEQRFLGDRAHISATYFNRVTRNQIAFVSCFGVTSPLCADRPNGTYDNIARANTDGVEVEAAVTPVQGFDLTGNYTHVDARNRTPGSSFDKLLARRPQDTGSISADYRSPIGVSGGVTATFVGPSFDDAGNATRLGGYTLVDLRAAYALTRKVEVYGRIENLLDERYETIFQYGTYPRAAYAGVRVRI